MKKIVFICLFFPIITAAETIDIEKEKQWAYLEKLATEVEINDKCIMKVFVDAKFSGNNDSKSAEDDGKYFEIKRDKYSDILGTEAESYIQKYLPEKYTIPQYRTFVWGVIGNWRDDAYQKFNNPQSTISCLRLDNKKTED